MSTKSAKPSKRSKDKGKSVENPVEKSPEPAYHHLTSSDSEESDVGEEGIARLMAALGEDGLDDVAQHMLEAMDEEKNEETESNEGENDAAEGCHSEVRIDAGSEDDESGTEGQAHLGDEEEEGANGSNKEFEDEGAEMDENAIELDEVSSVDQDAVPHQKITIDNTEALERIRDSIKLNPGLSWTETLTVTCPTTHNVDVANDLDRELSFYKQALQSAEIARTMAASHSLPFTRPTDYFAEMVKSDAHMERIRQRLLDETAGIKKSEEKRKEREGKKFGKQVQTEKVREREKGRKDLDEKIKGLKRKRKGGALEDPQGEDFDIALEDAITDRPTKRPRMPRSKRDEKYGRGGRGSVGWRSKQNTRESTDMFDSGNRGRGRGHRGGRGGRGASRGTKRLGKSRRISSRGN